MASDPKKKRSVMPSLDTQSKHMVETHWPIIEAVAEALLVEEEMDRDQFMDIVEAVDANASLAPPPGVGAIVSGGSRGEYNTSALLQTDMTLGALLEHYRQRVLQPDWKVQQETMDGGLAALTWTFRDEADYPWFGVLLITLLLKRACGGYDCRWG